MNNEQMGYLALVSFLTPIFIMIGAMLYDLKKQDEEAKKKNQKIQNTN